MRYSIVPEILNSKKIEFLDEKDIEVSLCGKSHLKYVSPFTEPFIIVDTFAQKTSKPEELINIDPSELKKLGFVITTIKAGKHRWFSRQIVIYRIEPLSNPSPGSKKNSNIPLYHKIKKDIINNKIRLIGPNAGFPHRGGGGPWILIK